MAALATRLEELSPERRRVLERLLRTGAEMPAAKIGAARPSPASLGDEAAEPVSRDPVGRFYDSVNRQLDAAEFGPFARFLNYGYLSNGNGEDRAVVELPPYALNKPSLKLVLELVGDCDLDGRDVLDVGCGRGGLVDTLATFFRPRRAVGVDLCVRAVRFARKASPQRNVAFFAADAQRLPFADRSFDVVTNLESSHTYPCVADFYRDVARVLRPGGAFLYSDAVSIREQRPTLELLRELGFRVEVERDITANVLLACDADAARRGAAFRGAPKGGTLEDFLAMPGSRVYEKLNDRSYLYLMFRLRKAAEAP